MTITASCEPAGSVSVSVHDTGCGIDHKDLPHLFDPFFTTRRSHGGTGLGLFVSRGIVEGHNGAIEAVSAPDKGTTFTVRLPAGEAASRRGSKKRRSR